MDFPHLQLDLFRRGDGAITSALADLNFKASEIAHLAPWLKGRPKFLFVTAFQCTGMMS